MSAPTDNAAPRSAVHTAAVTLPPALALLPELVDKLGPETAAIVFVAVTLIPAVLTRLSNSATFDALLTTVLPLLARSKGTKKCDTTES